MLNINQKIELKRECVDIPQAIKSGYSIVEVNPHFIFYNHITDRYDITPNREGVRVVLTKVGVLTRVFIFDELHEKVITPSEAYKFVKFLINMQEYGKQ